MTEEEIKAAIRNAEASLKEIADKDERLEIRRGINIDKERLRQLEAQQATFAASAGNE